ncbi:MAG: biopolymer transporter ExbD [Myxococcota bacterium]
MHQNRLSKKSSSWMVVACLAMLVGGCATVRAPQASQPASPAPAPVSTEPAGDVDEAPDVLVYLPKGKRIEINGEDMDETNVLARLKELRGDDEEARLSIETAPGVPNERLVMVVDWAQQAGFRNLSTSVREL